MTVQENDSCDEDSDKDIEEGDTKDDEDAETKSDDHYGGFAFTQKDVLCSIQDKAGISGSWILLDRQSTVDIFSNLKLLT